MTKLIKFLPVVILGTAISLAISSAWNDSPIVDEIPHIGAGYSYIQKADMRLNPEHPPLAKDVAGFAISFLDLKQTVFQKEFWTSDTNGQWNFGRNLIFNSGNNAIILARVAKFSQLIFFILSGWIIFYWTKKLYSRKAGLLALFLFSFSPRMAWNFNASPSMPCIPTLMSIRPRSWNY